MVRAFSLISDSLSYFIGYTLLHAQETIIVSPWLSNVNLRFPVNEYIEGRRMSLLDAIEELPERDVTLIVRSGEKHNEFVRDRLPDDVALLEVDDLHAKDVVCNEYAYLGSANITRGGLILNREICEIIENEYTDARTYIKEELNLDLPTGEP